MLAAMPPRHASFLRLRHIDGIYALSFRISLLRRLLRRHVYALRVTPCALLLLTHYALLLDTPCAMMLCDALYAIWLHCCCVCPSYYATLARPPRYYFADAAAAMLLYFRYASAAMLSPTCFTLLLITLTIDAIKMLPLRCFFSIRFTPARLILPRDAMTLPPCYAPLHTLPATRRCRHATLPFAFIDAAA